MPALTQALNPSRTISLSWGSPPLAGAYQRSLQASVILEHSPTSLKIIFAHPHRGAVPVQRGGGPVGSIEPTAAPNHPNHRVLLFGKVSRLGASQVRVPVLDPHQFCDSIVTLEPTRISMVDSFLIAHPLTAFGRSDKYINPSRTSETWHSQAYLSTPGYTRVARNLRTTPNLIL
jgi:hypothetical protein